MIGTHEQRIKITDTLQEAIVKLADGNPGALSVLMQLARKNPEIDPDDFFQQFGALMSLDVEGVYGPAIWILYKDVCGQDIVRTIAVLRAKQLGLKFFDFHKILNDAEGCTPDFKVLGELRQFAHEEAVALVQSRLPGFAVGYGEEAEEAV